jgi:hypothetical protein
MNQSRHGAPTIVPTAAPTFTPTTGQGCTAADNALDMAFRIVAAFVSPNQCAALREACRGEEGAYFKHLVISLGKHIDHMPRTYDQDGKGTESIVYLHYFLGGSDWYITEKDRVGGVAQAFGYAILNGDTQNAEWGYISITELRENNVELDLHFENGLTLHEVKRKRQAQRDELDKGLPAAGENIAAFLGKLCARVAGTPRAGQDFGLGGASGVRHG